MFARNFFEPWIRCSSALSLIRKCWNAVTKHCSETTSPTTELKGTPALKPKRCYHPSYYSFRHGIFRTREREDLNLLAQRLGKIGATMTSPHPLESPHNTSSPSLQQFHVFVVQACVKSQSQAMFLYDYLDYWGWVRCFHLDVLYSKEEDWVWHKSWYKPAQKVALKLKILY